MKFLKLIKKNKENDYATWEKTRGDMIVEEIRKRYSLNEELAILRQRDSKPEEFAIYNEYVESCKKTVNAIMSE